MLKDQTSISTNNSGLRNLQLKRIFKWLRRDPPQQTIASEADQGDVGVRPDQTTDGEHSDDSSLSCSWADQADSSIFDTGQLVTEKSEGKDAVPHSTLRLEDGPPPGAEEDIGVDPYNTGRFDT
jgi:hypothetical protein